MMRNINFIQEDSDQSISEEEEFSPDWPENRIPLSVTTERKGQLGPPSEEEVEVPCFQEDEDFTSSPDMASISNINEDVIFEDERFSPKPDEACTWSAINKEAEELVYQTENARSSSMHVGLSYAKRSHQGGRGKSKPKLLFRFQSHREDTSSSLRCNNEGNMSSKVFSLLEELENTNRTLNEIPITVPIIEGEMIEQLSDCEVQPEPAFGYGHTNRSMADLLDSYQDMNDFQMENKEMQMVDERSISPVSVRELDYYEEPPEVLDSGPSTDDEACNQNMRIIVPFTEKKTITDKFDEVFGVHTADEDGPDTASLGTGVFGKLQQVIQNEKKKEMEFFKRMQTAGNSVGIVYIQLLVKYLTSKLLR